jgi:DNA-binding CsgD family transcriptional regulator
MKGLEKIRLYEHSDSASNLSEMSDLFDFLAEKDKEYEIAYEELSEEKEKAEAELLRVQGEIEKLSYSRKNEINPDDYENFVIGIGMLTKAERNIFEMYLAGKTAKEIIEATGIKESTLKFHNSNIYEKLGVASRKQMLRYAALYTQENGGKI